VDLDDEVVAQQPDERVEVWLARDGVVADIGRADIAKGRDGPGELREVGGERRERGELAAEARRVILERFAG
jgi:hypothetical protein